MAESKMSETEIFIRSDRTGNIKEAVAEVFLTILNSANSASFPAKHIFNTIESFKCLLLSTPAHSLDFHLNCPRDSVDFVQINQIELQHEEVESLELSHL